MRLPATVSSLLMGGATMVSAETDKADAENFGRWFRYVTSGDPAKAQHAVEELLLRVERMFLEPYAVISSAASGKRRENDEGMAPSIGVVRMCDFIAANFLDDIDATDIARAAALHPKYAMNLA